MVQRAAKQGQTVLEYTLIVVIILGVAIAMKDYVRRGFQGAWQSSVDSMAGQYDPKWVDTNIEYAQQTNSLSLVYVTEGSYQGQPGQWTNRLDTSNSLEEKTGNSLVGN
jgi:Flp pilus assembly pilin Flp